MKTIGLYGGSSLLELGPAADVQLFFDCVNRFVVPKKPECNWDIVTDRLYRRYLRAEELPVADKILNIARCVLVTVSTSEVDWGYISAPSSVTRLDPRKQTLGEVFSDYFEKFSRCRESAETFYKTFKTYQPVKIVVTDIPAFVTDKKRSPEEYDALSGAPFWV